MAEGARLEIERLLLEIRELDERIFERRTRALVQEYLGTGWIMPEMAEKILGLFN